jgi:protein ImuB
MIACVLIPRFALRVAGGRLDAPFALAPPPGSSRVVGEVSAPAEAAGVHRGMALGEALARSPSLQLASADPARAAELWDGLVGRLEGIGAAVESERPGEAFLETEGLRRLHGGKVAGVMAAARDAAAMPIWIAAAPTRFAAFLAAGRESRMPRGLSGQEGEAIVPRRALRRFLSPFPVTTLASKLGAGESEAAELVLALERLGLGTLGGLAALAPDQVADRFGSLGLRALRLARGEDEPLRPRRPREQIVAEIELPEGTAGPQLDHALGLVVDRLIADPARRGRLVLALRLSARLAGGGSWSVEQGLGRPTASPRIIDSLLAPRLEALPEPAIALRLWAIALGALAADQLELALDGREPAAPRLSSAMREVRAVAGGEALLKVIDVEPRSRVPERRVLLAPFPDR